MNIYEKRTYSVIVGQMQEVIRVYSEVGYPMFEAGGFSNKLVGYFISDTGPLHQLIHLWRFDDDADRRDFWQRLYRHPEFPGFAKQIRPLLLAQENQLLVSAPWGPRP